LSNDADLEGDSLTITSVNNSTNGSAVLDSQAGTITFTPYDYYYGPASFNYLVSDGLDSSEGTVNVDVAINTSGDGYISGTVGSDVLTGSNKVNHIYGMDGDDVINGLKGHDRIDGGAGNDTLSGGWGNDTYVFAMGGGTDTIDNSSSKAQDTDALWFAGDFEPETLWFTQDNNDLVIDVVGTDDRVIVQDWYTTASNELEEVHVNGQVLLANQVDQLVAAMASFSAAEPSSLDDLTVQQQSDLNAAIAVAWQAA